MYSMPRFPDADDPSNVGVLPATPLDMVAACVANAEYDPVDVIHCYVFEALHAGLASRVTQLSSSQRLDTTDILIRACTTASMKARAKVLSSHCMRRDTDQNVELALMVDLDERA